ncbi:MAG: hypothetical protein RKP46_11735 [Candidatus Accumulibacter sp.]|uniref:hypothetical protein n=1 Tax=Accumulibacter sp. TaxID=2053492 RepID=UPI00287A5530|nr:hypothetical protein [Accumulibacter sp.]MDS4015002.1 hypothetical protein [Accumulibacter sp.]
MLLAVRQPAVWRLHRGSTWRAGVGDRRVSARIAWRASTVRGLFDEPQLHDEDDMNDPSPQALAAGLFVEPDGSEPKLTTAGLFSLAGVLAFSRQCDPASSAHCLQGVRRVMEAASKAGLSPQSEARIWALFRHGYDPAAGDEHGKALAALCRLVAAIIGPDLMRHLLSGEGTH